MNKQIAILTMDSLEQFHAYDHLLEQPFADVGWQTTQVSWRQKDTDWSRFDVVIVRSPWDYQQDPIGFKECLTQIEHSSAILENPYRLMLWNLEKTYLRDLANQGVPIVPTIWRLKYEADILSDAADTFDCDELIMKPVVSANADDTFRIPRDQIALFEAKMSQCFANRPLMIQPFLPAILDPGEYSLFFFDHQYSHAILKTPKQDDFRVQEEHGGQLLTVEPTQEMLAISIQTLNGLPDRALYARIDLINSGAGFAVMEVELIEPSLYFNMDEQSAQRFVDRFCEKYAY